MRLQLPRVAKLLCLAIMLLPLVEGQTITGTISGVVLDPAGSSIPDAKVTATNVANNAARSVQTNEAGNFT